MGCLITKKKSNDNIISNSQKELIKKYTINSTTKFIPDIRYGKVVKVYDGDTITIIAPVLNSSSHSIHKFSIRLLGIDCPEIKTKNSQEKKIAIIARELLESKILDKYIYLNNISYDKYGRILAEVYYDGQNMCDFMLDKRVAVKYNGGTKSIPKNWEKFYKNIN